MPTRCELIAKAKEKGLKGYSKMKKAELQALVEGGGGKAETPKKTYAFKKKEAPKPAPLKASGSARRVKKSGLLQYLYENEDDAKKKDRTRAIKVYVRKILRKSDGKPVLHFDKKVGNYMDTDEVFDEKGKKIGVVGEGIYSAMSDQIGMYRVKAKDTAKGKAGISLDNGDGGTITLNVGDKVELRNIKHNLNLKDGRSQEMKLGTGVGHANVMATVEGIDGNNVKFGFGDISNMIKQNQSGKETTPYSHRSINGKKTFTISRKQFDSSRKNMPKIANIISRGE